MNERRPRRALGVGRRSAEEGGADPRRRGTGAGRELGGFWQGNAARAWAGRGDGGGGGGGMSTQTGASRTGKTGSNDRARADLVLGLTRVHNSLFYIQDT
jgi:hypothetical protein